MNEFRSLAISLATVAILAAASVAAQERVLTAPGATYITGGSSEESRAQMKQQAAQFNVRASFALKSGEYLSDVDVAITDGSGKVMLTTTTDGPWLYARLAPGSYNMRATSSGVTQKQAFTVAAQGARELRFRWQGQP